jgi:uncharacterized protein involved in response to NO
MRVAWTGTLEAMNRRHLLILVALLLAACAPVVQSGGLTTETSDFTVEAYPATWRGQPMVAGRVYNKRPMRATRVRLRVEALDAAGTVVASDVRQLDRDVDFGDRVYFEVPPPAQAPAYRVSVDYVFWRSGGPGA